MNSRTNEMLFLASCRANSPAGSLRFTFRLLGSARYSAAVMVVLLMKLIVVALCEFQEPAKTKADKYDCSKNNNSNAEIMDVVGSRFMGDFN